MTSIYDSAVGGLINMLGQVWIIDTGSKLVTGDWVVTRLHLVQGVHLMADGRDHPLVGTSGQPTTATTFVHFVHFPAFVRHTG